MEVMAGDIAVNYFILKCQNTKKQSDDVSEKLEKLANGTAKKMKSEASDTCCHCETGSRKKNI